METAAQETKQQKPENANRPLNLLYLSSWYPTQQQPALGIFVKRHALAASLLHRVTLVHAIPDSGMKEGEFRIEKKEEGNFRELILHYGKIGKGMKWLRRWKNWRLLKKHYRYGLEKAIEWSGTFDLLHLHVPWPLHLIAWPIVRKLNIPYVVSEHWTGYLPEDGRYKGSFLKRVTRQAVRNAVAVVPVSRHLQEQMERHGLEGRYTVVPNVVDTNLFLSGSNTPETSRFIHISSLDDSQKNVSGLLKAFYQAKKKEPSLQLLIVGSGADESALKRLSNELSLTLRGVDFRGQLPEQELIIEIQNSTALVMNSRFETQGVVILEAFSCGIPVVAGHIGAVDELIEPERGILFEPGNEEALANALLEMHRKKQTFDRSRIRTYAVERFSREVIAAQLDTLYRKIMGWES